MFTNLLMVPMMGHVAFQILTVVCLVLAAIVGFGTTYLQKKRRNRM